MQEKKRCTRDCAFLMMMAAESAASAASHQLHEETSLYLKGSEGLSRDVMSTAEMETDCIGKVPQVGEEINKRNRNTTQRVDSSSGSSISAHMVHTHTVFAAVQLLPSLGKKCTKFFFSKRQVADKTR